MSILVIHTDANSGPAMYDSPFQMMPPGNHHTPSSPTGSHLYYTAPGSPYEQPRPSRSNTLAASINQQQHSLNQEEEEKKRVELAALLREKMKCSSGRAPESLEIGVLSSERGDRTNGGGGGMKIYEEGVYHEPIEVSQEHSQFHDFRGISIIHTRSSSFLRRQVAGGSMYLLR